MVKEFKPKYTNSMSSANYLGRVGTTAAKYATLLGGIYSVCKDERDFVVAALFGAGYVISDTLNDLLREETSFSRASFLEKRIKEK